MLDDYDAEAAARTLAGGYFGYLTGQVCHSLTRVIVPRDRHDAVVETMAGIARGIVLGDPFDPATTSGPLASARQRDAVERRVAQGIAEGATLAADGRRPAELNRGFFFEPTVFGNVDNRSSLAQEEIFGPVVSVIPADDEADAVRMANDTAFGLNATVFTNDRERFLRVARQLRSGMVGHNGSRTDFSIGFGGFKQSGVGREGGVGGLEAFLEPKTVVLDEPADA